MGVREDSPLIGQLDLGDVVKMVDGIDVSKMERVSELIATLNANRGKERVLTIRPTGRALSFIQHLMHRIRPRMRLRGARLRFAR